VAPLLEHGKGLLTNGELKAACRAAVDRIQGRLGDADAGRLTLAEPADHAGGLSLPSAEGKLSVAPVSPVASDDGGAVAPPADRERVK